MLSRRSRFDRRSESFSIASAMALSTAPIWLVKCKIVASARAFIREFGQRLLQQQDRMVGQVADVAERFLAGVDHEDRVPDRVTRRQNGIGLVMRGVASPGLRLSIERFGPSPATQSLGLHRMLDDLFCHVLDRAGAISPAYMEVRLGAARHARQPRSPPRPSSSVAIGRHDGGKVSVALSSFSGSIAGTDFPGRNTVLLMFIWLVFC